MIRYIFIVTAVLLAVNIINANDNERINIWFVGYDGQIPVFRSTKCIENGRTCFWDSTIYKYVGGRLMETGFSTPNDTELIFVGNNIFVFKEKINGLQSRYHFKLNGEKIIALLNASSGLNWWPGPYTMNDEYFFIVGETDRSGGSTIFRFNYRTLAKIDTFNIEEYYSMSFGADSNYLYFLNQDPEDHGPAGDLYQMDIQTGVTRKVINIPNHPDDYMAIAVSLNLIYVAGEVIDYDKMLYAIFPDMYGRNGIFFSYEDNAFIITGHEMDTDKWHILRLDDLTEWKPY
jgi:hypothetical protein